MAIKAPELKLGIVADLGNLLKGMEKAANSIDDVGDSARGLDADMRDGEAAFDSLGAEAKTTARKVADAFDAISKNSRKTGRDVKRNMDDAGDGFKEFKNEAHQSGREAAASFQGGFSGIVDFAQETMAQALSGFGPLGAAAGIAGAVGIGLISKAFSDAKESAEEFRQKVRDVTSELQKSHGALSEAFIDEKVMDLTNEQLAELSRVAKEAGVSVGDLTRASVGDEAAQRRVAAQYQANMKELAAYTGGVDANSAAHNTQAAALQKVGSMLGGTNKATREATAAYETMRAALAKPLNPTVNMDQFNALLEEGRRNIERLRADASRPIVIGQTLAGRRPSGGNTGRLK